LGATPSFATTNFAAGYFISCQETFATGRSDGRLSLGWPVVYVISKSKDFEKVFGKAEKTTFFSSRWSPVFELSLSNSDDYEKTFKNDEGTLSAVFDHNDSMTFSYLELSGSVHLEHLECKIEDLSAIACERKYNGEDKHTPIIDEILEQMGIETKIPPCPY